MSKVHSTSVVQTRQDREKRARQQEILQAARELFTQKGYHETTLDEVAHHAGFGKGTLYNYFSSKEELLYAIIDQLVQEMTALAETAAGAASTDARTQFSRFARSVLTHARDNADLMQLIIREVKRLDSPDKNKRMQEIKERIIAVWQTLAKPLENEMAAGKLKTFDPVTLAMLYDGMLRFYCMNRFGSSPAIKDDDSQDAADLLVTVFFDGIAKH